MTVFATSLVCSISELREFLASIPLRATLYVDLEGDNVCRDGTVSLFTILVHQLQEIYIIDVLSLGYTAFTTASDSGETLKDILEDAGTTKCIWDVRNDANALWAHYEVDLAGVIDIQLFENASRQTGRDKEFLSSRDTAVRSDLNAIVGLANVERDRRPDSIWMPEQGSGEQMRDLDYVDGLSILSRPLARDHILNCTRGVLQLRGLRDVYMRRISIAWLGSVRHESAKRVADAQTVDFVPYSPAQTKGPWKSRLGTVGSKSIILEKKAPPVQAAIQPLKPNLSNTLSQNTDMLRMAHNPESETQLKGTKVVEKKAPRSSKLFRFSSYRNDSGGRAPRQPAPKIVESASGDWWD